MAKDRYEISLWDDVFVAANGNVPGHYEEEKIAVIGSDSMTTQCRAIEPKLVCNVNGKVTFTFKMYYRYHDELTGEDYDNPFLKLLVNERKVKVLWLGEWYDLIIKNIQESSNGKTVVYTCEDANINELAKTGFNLIFDDDLSYNNVEGGNQGTVEELVGRTIAGTDWVLGTSDTIQQFTEEAVYEVTATRPFSGFDMAAAETVSIGTGKTFLVYYPQIADAVNNSTAVSTLSDFYFAYDSSQQYNRLAKTEMLVSAACCGLGTEGTTNCTATISNSTITFATKDDQNVLHPFGSVAVDSISSRYRANRLVREQVTKIEPVTGKYCYVYKYRNSNDLFYKTIETEFKDATYAANLFVNGSNFTAKADGISPAGWDFPSTSLSLAIYPTPDVNQQGKSTVFVDMIAADTSEDRYFYNDALKANSIYFSDGVKKGEKYVFRIKAQTATGSNPTYPRPVRLKPFIGEWAYTDNNNKWPVDTGDEYFEVPDVASYPSGYDQNGGWATYILTCKKSFTASEIISKKIGLFIKQPHLTDEEKEELHKDTYYRVIKEVEFFKYIEDSDGIMMEPGKLDKVGAIKTLYTYFDITNKKKVNYLYSGTVDWGSIPGDPVYDNTYSKIRSINIKQSNRFNILQTIAETFECWIRFNVPHDINTGQLIYKDAEDHPCATPRKFVNILKEIGEERSIGFVYGIDLQSIQRTIESNSIVTKTIVLENNNEFGKNGTCRISRSSFNYPQTDYIYNFDYYINHGLLDGDELTKDLYYNSGDETTTQGFYKNLHDWNLEYEELAQKYSDYSLALLKNQGLQTVYESTMNTAGENEKQAKKDVCNYLGTSAYTNQSTQRKINEIMNGTDATAKQRLQPLLETIETNIQIKAKYGDLLKELQGDSTTTPPKKGSIKEYEDLIESCEDDMLDLEAKIGAKTELFEKKYARFISEGSWTDSKYYDDNLYYLDANSVAYTSSRPKVSYNISVIRVTGLKDFWMKDFALGDISYIEDTEFFGYTYIQEGDRQVKTPYREKVIITEITYNFDEPNKDTFKVQNYRTQFEDLFQRIAAQTQSLQYSTGIYNKVSDIIKTDSTIKSDILKASFDANSNVLDRTSVNNMVTTDDAGITVTNIQNASEAVRVTSGGLFITTDGGDSWQNAIRGDGIGTQYLTSGAIDTKKIQIFGETGTDENSVAFKWDADGLNAYDKVSAYVAESTQYAYDPLRFVRLNGSGLTIQEATGDFASASRSTYTKLQLGQVGEIGTGSQKRTEYGLKINSYIDGAVETALAATDTGLYVKGNISAKSLVIGPTEQPILEVIDGEVSTAVTSITDGFPYTNLLRNSDTFDGWSINSNADVIVNNEANQIKFHWAAAASPNWVACVASDTTSEVPENDGFLIPYSALKGKKVTFSAYVASDTSDTSKQPDDTNGNKMRIWVGLREKGNNSTVRYRMHRLLDSATDPALSTDWTRWQTTETINDNYFLTGGGEGNIQSNAEYYVVFAFYCQTPWNYLICKPQIEINDHASDWNPSSGDQGFRVQSASIKIERDRITSEVSDRKEYQSIVNKIPSIYHYEVAYGNDWTGNGIRYHIRTNGQIAASGTTSSNTSTFWLTSTDTTSGKVPPIFLDSTKKYFLSGCPAGGGSSTYQLRARCFKLGETITSSGGKLFQDSGSGVVIEPPAGETGYTYMLVYLWINSNQDITGGKLFQPQVTVGPSKQAWQSPRQSTDAMYSRIIQEAERVESEVRAGTPVINLVPSTYGTEMAHPSEDGKYTVNGLTFTVKTNGQVTVYGTATQNTAYYLCGPYVNSDVSVMYLDPSKTYYISGSPANSTLTGYRMVARCYDADHTPTGSGIEKTDIAVYDAGTSISGYRYLTLMLYINSGVAISSNAPITYSPQVEVGTSRTLWNSPRSGAFSKITQTAYGITMAVAKDSLVTEINARADQLDLRSSRIKIEGYTTINGAFSIDNSGSMHASAGGDIAGWIINSQNITQATAITAGQSGTQYSTVINANAESSANSAFWVRERSYTSAGATGNWQTNFHVKYNGELYATKANITGTISAAAGSIGGLTIEGKFLHNGTSAAAATVSTSSALVLSGGQEFSRNINGTKRDHLRFALGEGFGVSTGGKLYASNVVISGDITATSGTIGDCTITNNSLVIPNGKITASQIQVGTIDISGLNGQISANQINADTINAKVAQLERLTIVQGHALYMEGSILFSATTGQLAGMKPSWYQITAQTSDALIAALHNKYILTGT